MKQAMKKTRRSAFTLIELLVVIAVIAVLMGILMPSLRKARAQARAVACAAHVKNLGVAFRMYLDDNDGITHTTPNQGLWDNEFEGFATVTDYEPDHENAYWGISYLPYALNKKVFECPDTVRNDDWPEIGWGVLYQKYFKYCSYGLNGYIASTSNRPTRVDQKFRTHSETVVFQDHIEQKLDSINSDMFCIGPSSSINIPQWRPGNSLVDVDWQGFDTVRECFRHSKASNTCWLDGHVSKIKQSTGEDVPTYWYDGDRSRVTGK